MLKPMGKKIFTTLHSKIVFFLNLCTYINFHSIIFWEEDCFVYFYTPAVLYFVHLIIRVCYVESVLKLLF